MLETILEIILMNLYWLSLPLIGYAILRLFKNNDRTPTSLRSLADIILRQHPFMVIVASFAVTTFIFAVISIFFYVFRWQVLPFVVIYLLLLIFTVIYLFISRSKKRFDIEESFGLKNESQITKLLFIMSVLLIVISFAIYASVNLIYGANDSMYHLARIVDIVGGGFNVQSSYHNVFPESGYHYNVLYSYYAIAAKLFNYIPMTVWRYSLGFFNLMSLFASFSFSLFVFSKWLKIKSPIALASVSMFALLAFQSYYAYIANYPDRVVRIWEILLVICLSQNITKKNFKPILIMLLGLSLITTMTHTLHAAIFACFVVVFAVVRLILQRRDFIKDKLSQLTYLSTVAVLMIGAIITKLVPVRLPSAWIESFDPIAHFKIFGLTIIKPSLATEPMDWVLSAAMVVAVIYFIYVLRKRKFELAMVLSLMFIFDLFAFTPLCSLLNNFLPLWAIGRFSDITRIISQTYFTVAIFILLGYASKLIVKKYPNLKKNANFKTITTTVLFLLIAAPSLAYIANYDRFVFAASQPNSATIGYETFVKDYQNVLKDNKLVIAGDGYTLSALFRIDILSVPFSHDVVAADGLDRLWCQNYILKHYDYADLKATGVNYVIASNEERLNNSLDKKPYLKLIGSKKEYYYVQLDNVYVYEFIDSKKSGNGQVYKSCSEYLRKENVSNKGIGL